MSKQPTAGDPRRHPYYGKTQDEIDAINAEAAARVSGNKREAKRAYGAKKRAAKKQ